MINCLVDPRQQLQIDATGEISTNTQRKRTEVNTNCKDIFASLSHALAVRRTEAKRASNANLAVSAKNTR